MFKEFEVYFMYEKSVFLLSIVKLLVFSFCLLVNLSQSGNELSDEDRRVLNDRFVGLKAEVESDFQKIDGMESMEKYTKKYINSFIENVIYESKNAEISVIGEEVKTILSKAIVAFNGFDINPGQYQEKKRKSKTAFRQSEMDVGEYLEGLKKMANTFFVPTELYKDNPERKKELWKQRFEGELNDLGGTVKEELKNSQKKYSTIGKNEFETFSGSLLVIKHLLEPFITPYCTGSI